MTGKDCKEVTWIKTKFILTKSLMSSFPHTSRFSSEQAKMPCSWMLIKIHFFICFPLALASSNVPLNMISTGGANKLARRDPCLATFYALQLSRILMGRIGRIQAVSPIAFRGAALPTMPKAPNDVFCDGPPLRCC